jgi:hypothetical protein
MGFVLSQGPPEHHTICVWLQHVGEEVARVGTAATSAAGVTIYGGNSRAWAADAAARSS